MARETKDDCASTKRLTDIQNFSGASLGNASDTRIVVDAIPQAQMGDLTKYTVVS